MACTKNYYSWLDTDLPSLCTELRKRNITKVSIASCLALVWGEGRWYILRLTYFLEHGVLDEKLQSTLSKVIISFIMVRYRYKRRE